ncbi:phosphate signaling complex protein PhoU [Minwuia thermotolerans]|uniref:Phosphate-specific transport system accessory protein PhoU n=1 Tax=Minwuia thermotolerans TaxID=2056226 RepID=A0A2M9FXA8_9PROT|nr:phosphate signaling complex protein PhoU [Minwuia thermotolerans]PJK28096.1 phosphate transport system regulatory protein PhoU [Minwuia thermotolerans]
MASHEPSTPHTVSSYEEELTRLNNLILELGGLVEAQLSGAIRAMTKRDSDAAERLIVQDLRIDELEETVNDLAVNILARRQPVAGDLRLVVSVIKIAGDLERLGDYAKNIAKRTLVINQSPPIAPLTTVPRMSERVQRMLDQALTAFVQGDDELAEKVWAADEEVDELYNSFFRELLTYMMEDPRNISAAAHLLFVAKNIERMGDLVTNIAERIYFTATGHQIEAERPKRDVTSLTDVSDDGAVTTETP